jgi:hypothetical protein
LPLLAQHIIPSIATTLYTVPRVASGSERRRSFISLLSTDGLG